MATNEDIDSSETRDTSEEGSIEVCDTSEEDPTLFKQRLEKIEERLSCLESKCDMILGEVRDIAKCINNPPVPPPIIDTAKKIVEKYHNAKLADLDDLIKGDIKIQSSDVLVEVVSGLDLEEKLDSKIFTSMCKFVNDGQLVLRLVADAGSKTK
jgi:hypothetical protein